MYVPPGNAMIPASVPNLSYVLITPARNEEAAIEKTIQSVIAQSKRPVRWVIVSDGSTDGTDDIVKRYLRDHDWMDFCRMPEHRERTFAAKVSCFNAGYERVRGLEYDLIGSLDADISFGSDYFEFLLRKFGGDDQLGVAGTPFVEGVSGTYNYSFTNIEHVSGACQVFRRKCFEDIGGYTPVKAGGIDWIAVTTARMKGWKTRTFPEKTCFHHRPMGTANSGSLRAWFKHGNKDYYLGGHPLWMVFRTPYQMASRPYVLGGLCLLCGYIWAAVSGMKRPISRELMEFTRQEQMARLRSFLTRAFTAGNHSPQGTRSPQRKTF
jgi:glycosyltransferase involved in cell wall biosynthesis